MAGYLVYRPTATTPAASRSVGYQVGAVIVNGADAAGAIAAAKAQIARVFGPQLLTDIDSWTALQIDATDLAASTSGTIFSGDAFLPGSRFVGGSTSVIPQG
jgi:hypothetical protein